MGGREGSFSVCLSFARGKVTLLQQQNYCETDGGTFFFSLSFHPLSVFVSKKPVWESTRQDGSHADGTGGI
jgi:hypothetical protein